MLMSGDFLRVYGALAASALALSVLACDTESAPGATGGATAASGDGAGGNAGSGAGGMGGMDGTGGAGGDVGNGGAPPVIGVWLPFADASKGLSGKLRPIAVGDDGNLFIGSDAPGVYRTQAPGKAIFSQLSMTGLDNTKLSTIAVNAAGTPLLGCWDQSSGGTGPHDMFWFNAAKDRWIASTLPSGASPTRNVTRFLTTKSGTLFAVGGWSPILYQSQNGGVSYQAVDLNTLKPPSAPNLGLLFFIVEAPDGELIIGTEQGGFYHSLDGGVTFGPVDPLAQSPVAQLGVNCYGVGFTGAGEALFSRAFDASGHMMYRRTAQGQFVTADDGLAAYKFNSTSQNSIRAIVTTDSGDNLVATTKGVFRSKDGGPWEPFNEGLPGAPLINNIVAWHNTVYLSLGDTIYVLHTGL